VQSTGVRRQYGAYDGTRGTLNAFFKLALAAMGIHGVLLCLFTAVDVPVLAWFNVASVVVYALTAWLVRRGRPHTALLLGTTEVMMFTALASIMLGWSSGFHYYLFALPPMMFLSGLKQRFCVLAVIAVSLLYVSLSILLDHSRPVAALPELWLELMRYANVATTITVIGLLSFVYRSNVNGAVRRLKHMAATDPLTGLTNRREFFRRAEAAGLADHATVTGYALLLYDIDNFKQINDRYGHDVGDRILYSVGLVLQQTDDAAAIVTRWGGEEFLILLPGATLDDAESVAAIARRRLARAQLVESNRKVRVTVTVGLAEHRSDETLEQCIIRADTALRAGKRQGKNRATRDAR